MFGALKQGSTLFVLDKSNKPVLKIGTIETTTQPTVFNAIPYAPLPNQTFDVKVKFEDGESFEFQQMNSSLSVQSYGNIIVTETREQMMQEVDSMERVSKQMLETVPYHQSVVESAEEIRSILSPSFRKEKETDERLNSLEKGLGDIKEILAEMSQNISSSKSKQ